jgi:hypothetical protein
LREAKKIRLRQAYFGSLTLREIAKANAVGEKFLERFWRDEKAAGRLANVARPHFAKFCKPAASLLPEAGNPARDDGTSPLGEPNPRYERECSDLLAALREHHADTDHPDKHIAYELLAVRRAKQAHEATA